MKTCYMCEAEAAPGPGEHVPPRCVFPDYEEHTKNLITVPSCPKHNVNKSADDQLLCHYLTTANGNNKLALEVFDAVVMPALEDVERPYLVKTFLPNLRPARLGRRESRAYTLDIDRFFSSIECIVRGLYFHETDIKLLENLEVVWGALVHANLSEAPFKAIIDKWEPMLTNDYIGTNKIVFQYAFHYFGGQSNWLCRLRFYEGPPIYILWERKAEYPAREIVARWRFLERPMPIEFMAALAGERKRDLDTLTALANADFQQFRILAPLFVNANPFKSTKKGVDGIKFFRDLDCKEPRKVVVSVKSGKLKTDDVRALASVRGQQDAEIALLVTLDEPTRGIASDAAAEGFYTSLSGKKYPRVQILTVADLLDGKARAEHPDYEPDLNFKKAKAEKDDEQPGLL